MWAAKTEEEGFGLSGGDDGCSFSLSTGCRQLVPARAQHHSSRSEAASSTGRCQRDVRAADSRRRFHSRDGRRRQEGHGRDACVKVGQGFIGSRAPCLSSLPPINKSLLDGRASDGTLVLSFYSIYPTRVQVPLHTRAATASLPEPCHRIAKAYRHIKER